MNRSANNNSSSSSGGIGVLGLLQVAFIILKICEVGKIATWSWWLVFLPTWIGIGLVIFVIILAILFANWVNK